MPTKSDLHFASRELRNGLDQVFPPPDAWFDLITAGLDAIDAGSLTRAVPLDENLQHVVARNGFFVGVSGNEFLLGAAMRSNRQLGELRERFRLPPDAAAQLLACDVLTPSHLGRARAKLTRAGAAIAGIMTVGMNLRRQMLVETWTHPALGDGALRVMKTMLLARDGAPREN